MHALQKFLQLPFSQKRMLVEAGFLLAVSRIMVFLFPFKKIQSAIQQKSTALARPNEKKLEEIHYCIAVASRYAPWKNACLNQAITGKVMLNRRGISGTFFLGVKQEEGRLNAHAWLVSGDVIVTGGRGVDLFRPIASFT